MIKELWAAIHVGDGMQKINLPFFYQLGSRLHPLAQMTQDKVDRIEFILLSWDVRNDVQTLLERFEALNVCRAAAAELLEAINSYNAFAFSEKHIPKDWKSPIEASESVRIGEVIRKAKDFEIVLSNELSVLEVYHPAKKGIYSTSDLIAQAENALPESVRCKLTPEVVNEIRESGKCLAFGNSTASGFHIMRATELVLHEYYVAVCKPEKPEKRLDNWGGVSCGASRSSGEPRFPRCG